MKKELEKEEVNAKTGNNLKPTKLKNCYLGSTSSPFFSCKHLI